MQQSQTTSRRDFLAQAAMWAGLILAYGILAVQGVMFVLPRRRGPKTRFLFVGQIADFELDSVRTVRDLQGTPILVKRGRDGFHAYSSICPHLGCRVRWEQDNARFFCPCHRGVFDQSGVAVEGPPADAGQKLAEVPLKVDDAAGVLYLEVKDVKRRQA